MMKKILNFTVASLVMASSFLATSCDESNDSEDGYYSKTPDNKYSGESTLSALGLVVTYDNNLILSNNGTVVVIDSITFKPMYNIKHFEIKDLKFNKTHDNCGTITLDSTKTYVVERDSIKFEILDANCTVDSKDGEFTFLIHPEGMPGDGFTFTLKGNKQCFDE